MRSCSAAYVDVGYLLAAAATRVTGSSLRRGVTLDYRGLITALIEQIETDSGLPLLRVNWYDAGSRPGGMPDAMQDDIGALPRVKLRLGRLSYSGEQKGVDVRIGLDLAIQAQHRVADVAYLVSGDDDLTEAVEEAQGRGVQVVLLAVPDHDGSPLAVSRHLIRAADRVLLIEPSTIDGTVKSLAIPEGLLATLAGDAEPTREAGGDSSAGADPGAVADGAAREPRAGETTAPGGSAPGEGVPGLGVGARRTGEDAAPARPRRRLRTHAGTPVPGPTTAPQAQPAEAAPDPASLVPSPAMLARRKATELVLPGTPDQPSPTRPTAPIDPAGAPELSPDVIDDVAKRVVAAWCSSATPTALIQLKDRRPAIPAELDRALLVDLAGRGGGADLDDGSRHAVRDRFWYHIGRVRMA